MDNRLRPFGTATEATFARLETQAQKLRNQGNLTQAELIYRYLMHKNPSNPIIYVKLATICGLTGRQDELLLLAKKAVEINPSYPAAYNCLGIGLKATGDLAASIRAYRRAVELNPDFAEAHYNLGNALRESNLLDSAVDSYTKALALNPKSIGAYTNLGIALYMLGKLDEAESAYLEAIRIRPENPDSYYNLGLTLQSQGKPSAAIDSYKKALDINQNNVRAHISLGNALLDLGMFEAAIESYSSALQLEPEHPDAHYRLALILHKLGRIEAAIESYLQASALRQNHPELLINYGNALQEQGNFEAAIESYKSAIRLQTNHPDLHYNLGIALKEQGKVSDAIQCYKTALQLNPDHTEARWNLSLALLLSGDYDKGLEEYQYRLSNRFHQGSTLNARPQCSEWDGSHLDKHEQLLLVSEQGLGDTLQFMRYTHYLRHKGYRCSLCAPSKLHGLIKASSIDSNPLTPEQANCVSTGHWAALLSLPLHLGVRPENPIITDPYISTTKELREKWRKILAQEKKPLIGINWQGNPEAEKTYSKGRSLPLESFAPIAECQNAAFVSLQKGFGSEQLETCTFKSRFVQSQQLIDVTWDYLETAAIISNCDLVITSDTAVAHLAGGMGKATWLLLAKVPDWRWGLQGDTTFWYPSMRVFRQKIRGDWHEVLARVASELRLYLANHGTNRTSSDPCL